MSYSITRNSLIPALATLLLLTACTTSGPTARAAAPASQPAIVWEKWSDDLFDRAKKENRLVILDLEAVWCHWCHVMEETTYRDEAVRRLIGQKYIAVRVDQDSRPDLSNRYEDYGWPATIVFSPDGKELAKRQGYLRPLEMSSMLQAFIDDPTPGPSVQTKDQVQPAVTAALSREQRDRLIGQMKAAYDTKNAGWGTVHKFIDADVIEFCLASGDADLRRMARETLDAATKLIDPAWGGVYQYSTDGDWDHQHFEKIMSYQADDLRTYARASVSFHDPGYLKSAESIHHFLKTFLTSPQGAFYTSQDADLVQGEHSAEYFALSDSDRRKRGVPVVDQHLYARENGWAIEALATLYGITGDDAALTEATHAADWIIAHRALDGGGFAHGEKDEAGPYLGDSLAMGRAFLALYTSTAEARYLTRALATATFIEKNFALKPAGYATAVAHGSFPSQAQTDENVSLSRLTNLLFAYTGKPELRTMAERAMKYLAAPQVAGKRAWGVGGILLADQELTAEPIHITIVGPKNDPAAKALFQTALSWPTGYKRVEWYDRREGPLAKMDVEYPELAKPAAFLCTGTTCSSPMFTIEKMVQKRDKTK